MKLALLLLAASTFTWAADLQGILADWNCVPRIVQDGLANTLKHEKACSLNSNYSRAAYGLVTSEKHYYRLDDAGRGWALKLLKDSPDKDNLKVIVTGEIEGDTIHVKVMSEL